MNTQRITCPVAIADETFGDGFESEENLLNWCISHMRDGESLTMWVTQKNILSNNDFLKALSSHSAVNVVFSRGSLGTHRVNGPVIAFYPSPKDLSEFNDIYGMAALGVVAGFHPLTVWVDELGVEGIGDVPRPAGFDEINLPLSELAAKALESAGWLINHNNTITGHFERRQAKAALETMRSGGCLPNPDAAIEQAAAAGWRHDNPKQLGEWVQKYLNGGSIRLRQLNARSFERKAEGNRQQPPLTA